MNYLMRLLLITVFLVPLAISAQSVYMIGNINDLLDLNHFAKAGRHDVLTEDDIEGSPYENKEFVNGFLVTIDNKKYDNIPLRLNIYNDDIEYKTKKGEIFALSNREIMKFVTIGDSKYKYIPYPDGKRTYKSYFKVIEEGEASLLVKQRILFKEAQPAAAYKDPVPPTFNKKLDVYYIKLGDGLAQRVDKKKDLILILSPELETFIKKNKIKANRLEDLQKVVRHYNMM